MRGMMSSNETLFCSGNILGWASTPTQNIVSVIFCFKLFCGCSGRKNVALHALGKKWMRCVTLPVVIFCYIETAFVLYVNESVGTWSLETSLPTMGLHQL